MNRNYDAVILAVITLLLITISVTPICNKVCPPGNLCCNDLNNNNGNPTCYNPNTHQCNNGNRLCPKNYLSCGKACYSNSVYQCNPGNKLCPAGYLSCGSSCYNPYQYGCVNGRLVNKCVPGRCTQLLCCPTDGACYNPNHQYCTNNGLVWRCFGIPATDPAVCGGHGTCGGLDICICRDGYSGVNCFVPPR